MVYYISKSHYKACQTYIAYIFWDQQCMYLYIKKSVEQNQPNGQYKANKDYKLAMMIRPCITFIFMIRKKSFILKI